jgi:osmotically-inducible protein OsmY
MMTTRRPLPTAVLVLTLLVAVVTPAAAETEDRLLGQRLKDVAITALVKARLVAGHPASAVRVDVDTDEGVVRLRGTVPDEDAWARAQRVAEGTPGVRRVRNELQLAEPPA